MQDALTQQDLRARAEGLASTLPALIARSEDLAQSVLPGAHGRRRAGAGALFWQYRRAEPHESRRIDWRRSARSDQLYVQEREWQAPQTIGLWVESDARMDFGAETNKGDLARLLAMSLAIGLLRGSERVGLPGLVPSATGAQHKPRIAEGLFEPIPLARAAELPLGARLVAFSDFLGPLEQLETALAPAVARRIRPVLVQILHPDELEFPYQGRVIFENMQGAAQFDSRNARSLRDDYHGRLEQHQEALRTAARRLGAALVPLRADTAPGQALLKIWHALEATP